MATIDCTARRAREDRTIERAMRILEKRVRYRDERVQIVSPDSARKFLRLRLHGLLREEFWCCWLDAQSKIIDVECLFVGTLTQTSVYPREVVRCALNHNASSVILAHNHPSGECFPSQADQVLTRTLKDALSLIDVKVLDHFIVGDNPIPFSFLEKGLI